MMENNRIWYIGGQKVCVPKRLHNYLCYSRERIIKKDIQEAEHRVFSLDEELSDVKLEEQGFWNPAFDDPVLVKIVMEEALANISQRSQVVLRTVYYEHVSVSEFARRVGFNVKRMQREVKQALAEMKEELDKMGVTKMEDLV